LWNEHYQLRRGNAQTARNVLWFLRETRKRVPDTASKKLRADSGFYRKAVVEWCEAEECPLTITADQTAPLLQAITALPAHRWRCLPEYELAEVAELRYQSTGRARPYRSVVNREVAETKAGELYWKYHATVTNEEGQSTREVVVWHLQHAAMENAIKEHIRAAWGWRNCPRKSAMPTGPTCSSSSSPLIWWRGSNDWGCSPATNGQPSKLFGITC
jgi:Transposase DDE domain group 1